MTNHLPVRLVMTIIKRNIVRPIMLERKIIQPEMNHPTVIDDIGTAVDDGIVAEVDLAEMTTSLMTETMMTIKVVDREARPAEVA